LIRVSASKVYVDKGCCLNFLWRKGTKKITWVEINSFCLVEWRFFFVNILSVLPKFSKTNFVLCKVASYYSKEKQLLSKCFFQKKKNTIIIVFLQQKFKIKQ
jgi:hypothetical protein